MRTVPVLIVGGGPIGLALAADLGRRGIEAMLVEKRQDVLGSAKMILVSVRTMEFCRQLGISEEIRNWGFPHDHNLDSVFVTNLQSYELGRVHTPAIAELPSEPASPERDFPCPQTWFDPIVQRYARRFPHVELRYEIELESFEQDTDGVIARLLDADGRHELVHADYLVGCDGYSSTVRALLGIDVRGERFLDLSMSVYVRIPHLLESHDKGDAYRYVFVGPDGTWGVLTTIDGFDLYRLQLIGSSDKDVRSIDVPAALRRAIGDDIGFTIEDVSFWSRKMVVADRFKDGRVFIAGDAAHAHPPNGGLGMNTGIADAFDLGWKFAAVLEGWGGPTLLESYDYERRPASARAAEESLRNYRRLTNATNFREIDQPTSAGALVREELGLRLVAQNEKAWHPLGVHLGYIYDPSPIVARDGSPRPADDPVTYEPSAYPGARAPHFWLAPGRSTLDLFGDGFTLLVFDDRSPAAFRREASRQGVPLTVHHIDDADARAGYAAPLVLVRPDGHVAWRGDGDGDGDEADIDEIFRTIRGAGPPIAARRTNVDARVHRRNAESEERHASFARPT